MFKFSIIFYCVIAVSASTFQEQIKIIQFESNRWKRKKEERAQKKSKNKKF